jgi:predicted nuclease with TOPRIM domain
MLQQKIINKSIREKILIVRKEIHVLKLQYKHVHNKVYHDQMEELHSTLHKLKQKLNKDVLDEWCEKHPDDLECRCYDV